MLGCGGAGDHATGGYGMPGTYGGDATAGVTSSEIVGALGVLPIGAGTAPAGAMWRPIDVSRAPGATPLTGTCAGATGGWTSRPIQVSRPTDGFGWVGATLAGACAGAGAGTT